MGSDAYWATVSAPIPVALAVVASFVAVAIPVELVEDPLEELSEPTGTAGAVGGGEPPPMEPVKSTVAVAVMGTAAVVSVAE